VDLQQLRHEPESGVSPDRADGQLDLSIGLAVDAFAGSATRGYLNTASVGLPPDAAVAAACAGARDWQRAPDWLAWEAVGEQCREEFAGLVGVHASDVALVGAAHVAAGITASAMPDRPPPGTNIVALRTEHQSALWPFLALERHGYELRLVASAELASAIDERTAAVAVSLVQSADGSLIDLASIDTHDALVFVDGTQAVGVVDIPLASIDVLAVSGYKWLHCPRGIAFMVIEEERRQQIEPAYAAWKAAPQPWGDPYGPPRCLTDEARRFDLSLPWLLAPPALASLQLISEVGVERVGAHCRGLATACADQLGLPPTGTSILTVPAADPQRARALGLRCSVRNGKVRFAFAMHNDLTDVEAVIASVR
jgi:selenocysteine lyase/cysteine desulfurase